MSDVVEELDRWLANETPADLWVECRLMQHARDELIAQRERCAWLGKQVEEQVLRELE